MFFSSSSRTYVLTCALGAAANRIASDHQLILPRGSIYFLFFLFFFIDLPALAI